MNTSKPRKLSLLIAALGLTMLSGCGTTDTSTSMSAPAGSTMSANSGRLIIRRIPDLGTATVLSVSVDNKKVATLMEGQNYDAALSAGPHVVMVSPEPNVRETVPPQKKLNVKQGQTYAYTAAWKNDALILEQ